LAAVRGGAGARTGAGLIPARREERAALCAGGRRAQRVRDGSRCASRQHTGAIIMSQQRINALKTAPDAYQLLSNIEKYIEKSGLDFKLTHLVKMRASQINGCAYCLDMHSHDARARGETERRLYLLDAWQESALYDPRERAALAWTEALTRIDRTHAPDADFEL